MSLDGTYGFVYSGSTGIGIGVFVLKDGVLTGRDYSNAAYQGTAAILPDDSIDLQVRVRMPAGAFFVFGTSPQSVPHSRDFNVQMPAEFGDGAPTSVQLQGGSMYLMIKRVSDDFAPAAIKGFTLAIAP